MKCSIKESQVDDKDVRIKELEDEVRRLRENESKLLK